MDTKKQMKTLENTVRKWLNRSQQEPMFTKPHRDGAIENFTLFVEAQQRRSRLSMSCENLQAWHFNRYAHSAFNTETPLLSEFASSAHYAKAGLQFSNAMAGANKGGSILPNSAILYFALTALAGWETEAGLVGNILARGLDTPLLDLRHNDRHQAGKVYRHFWFVLHLYSKSGGLKFDTSLYSYPPDMSPYDAALAEWDTTDLAKVHEWVCAMADFHVQETRNTSHDNIDEFDAESVMLFPYEILCWLRLREWQGLSNPATFDHPLMQSPLARLPTPVPLPVPATPLLDQVIEKFKQEFPSSFS
jgi:hypothetical protein